jgi:hypothetical protein
MPLKPSDILDTPSYMHTWLGKPLSRLLWRRECDDLELEEDRLTRQEQEEAWQQEFEDIRRAR